MASLIPFSRRALSSACLVGALVLSFTWPIHAKIPTGWKIVQRPVSYTGDNKVALYFQGRYLVATSPGALYSSRDGKNWQSVEMGDLSGVSQAVRIKDRVAFVDTNGLVASSSNGTDWETSQIPGNPYIISIATNDTFAVGLAKPVSVYNGDRRLYRSTDLKTWTLMDSLAPDETTTLLWGANQWAAFDGTRTIFSSPDAQKWSKVYSGAYSNSRAPVFFNGRFFLCDSYGLLGSSDLKTWNSSGRLGTMKVAGNRAYLLKDYSIDVSDDGTTWRATSMKSVGSTTMVQGDSGLLQVVRDPQVFRYDTSDYSKVDSSWYSRSQWSGITECQGKLVAYGTNSFSIGATLQTLLPQALPVQDSSFSSLACNDSIMVGGLELDTLHVRYRDAWHSFPLGIALPPAEMYLAQVVWDGTQFVIIDSYNGLFVSPGTWSEGSGPTWTKIATPTTFNSTQCVAIHDTIQIFAGNGIFRGTHWSGFQPMSARLGYLGTIESMIWANGQFVGVGRGDSSVQTSPDGTKWTPHYTGLGGDNMAIGFRSGRYVTTNLSRSVRGASVVGFSTDLVKWMNLGTLPDILAGVLVQDTQIIVVGNNGLIASYSLPNPPTTDIESLPSNRWHTFQRNGSLVVPVPTGVTHGDLFGIDGRRTARIQAQAGELVVPRALLKNRRFLTFTNAASGSRVTVPLLSLDP